MIQYELDAIQFTCIFRECAVFLGFMSYASDYLRNINHPILMFVFLLI